MSRRITDEARIVDFFTNADWAKVETVDNIVRGIVKQRRANAITGAVTVAAPKKRKSRKRQPELPLGTEAAS